MACNIIGDLLKTGWLTTETPRFLRRGEVTSPDAVESPPDKLSVSEIPPVPFLPAPMYRGESRGSGPALGLSRFIGIHRGFIGGGI